LILSSVFLAPSQGLRDVEPVEKHKPTKREKQYIYSNENLCIRSKSYAIKMETLLLGRNVLLHYIDESGEYNLCLDVARSLAMTLFLNTHTFSPMLLMKSIHNLTWKAKEKLSQEQSSA
jgi:hypothetical protein